jgi:hypothetical protein
VHPPVPVGNLAHPWDISDVGEVYSPLMHYPFLLYHGVVLSSSGVEEAVWGG